MGSSLNYMHQFRNLGRHFKLYYKIQYIKYEFYQTEKYMKVMSVLVILPETFSQPRCTMRTNHRGNHLDCRQDQGTEHRHPEGCARGSCSGRTRGNGHIAVSPSQRTSLGSTASPNCPPMDLVTSYQENSQSSEEKSQCCRSCILDTENSVLKSYKVSLAHGAESLQSLISGLVITNAG